MSLPKIDYEIAKKLDKIDLWNKMNYISCLIPKFEDIEYGVELSEIEKSFIDESISGLIKLRQSLELRIMSSK